MTLQVGAGPRTIAGADNLGALQRVRDRAQERGAHSNVQRPGGGQDGRHFVVGKFERRHGGLPWRETRGRG